MTAGHAIGTLAISLLYCVVFLRGRTLDALGRVGHRRALSLAGGAAVAYVFVDLAPEVQEAAHGFREANAGLAQHVLEYGIQIAMMLGFVLFYGIEVLVVPGRGDADHGSMKPAHAENPMFGIHMLGFAAYVWTVNYLLVRTHLAPTIEFAFYAFAMALHFLGLAHGLRAEHGARYDRVGSRLLAAACLAGWASGIAFGMSRSVLAVLLGVLAGGIIANVMISELPRKKEGHFGAFVLGAMGYTVLLLLGR